MCALLLCVGLFVYMRYMYECVYISLLYIIMRLLSSVMRMWVCAKSCVWSVVRILCADDVVCVCLM